MNSRTFVISLLCLTQFFFFSTCRKESEQPDDSRTSQNSDNQCPCLSPKGSKKCLPYESKNQAATLEEALTSFADPKSSNPESAKPLLISNCADNGCRSCNQGKLQGFQQILAKQNKNSSLLQELQPLYTKYGLGLDAVTKTVEKLRADCRVYELRSRSGLAGKPIPNAIGGLVDSNNNNNNNNNNSTNNFNLFKPETSGRTDLRILPIPTLHSINRRQTNSNAQYYNIDCRNRGDPIEDGSVWCGLCDTCWQWAILTSDYFPSYISLMNCGSSARCLSGYGQCQVRTRGLTLLRNYGTSGSPNWKEYTFVSPMSCDCQVRQSSALSKFIRD